jgi:hypothetical protein
MPSDKDQFVEAVTNDEYAELELSTGDVLITDWEGDGSFNPYIVMSSDHGDKHPTDILQAVNDALTEVFDVIIYEIEYDACNDKLVPYMERPD